MNPTASTPIKRQPALDWLVPLVAVLALAASGAGLFLQGGPGAHDFTTLRGQVVEIYGRGMYLNDTTLIGSGLRGADAVAVFIGVPLLLISFAAYRRGTLRGPADSRGMRSASWDAYPYTGCVELYFLYMGMSLTFSAAFNRLFLVYVALFSASLFALFTAAAAIDQQALAERVSSRLPRRGVAAFLFVAGLGTFMLWLSELIGPILTGSAPANLGPYTTMFTHGFDSGTITPIAVLAGICLLRRKPLGYLLAPVILILCVLNGLNVLGATAAQTLAGLVFSPGVYIGLIGSWVVMGAFAVGLTIAFFRSLNDNPA